MNRRRIVLSPIGRRSSSMASAAELMVAAPVSQPVSQPVSGASITAGAVERVTARTARMAARIAFHRAACIAAGIPARIAAFIASRITGICPSNAPMTATRAKTPKAIPRSNSAQRGSRARQRGVALLALLVLVGIVAAVFVVRSLDADTLRAQQEQRTTDALATAREALLAFAAANDDRPGSFPCPDVNNDGRSTLGTEYAGGECTAYIGRLPWALLRIPELRDGSGETLWYALSRSFRSAGPVNETVGMVNPDTSAALSIIDRPDEVVAIVFAPGPALAGQQRDGPQRLLPPNYLDGVNATPTSAFSAAPRSATFNDRLLAVTRADAIALAERRVAREVVKALDRYFVVHKFLPAPGAFDNVQCVDDGTTAGCNPVPGMLAGRIPANIVDPIYAYGALNSSTADRLLRGDGIVRGPSDTLNPATEPTWFQLQRWREHVVYIVSPACVGPPANGVDGCPSGDLNLQNALGSSVPNARFIILMSGIAAGQARATPTDKVELTNYLEGSALAAVNELRAGTVPAGGNVVVPGGTVAVGFAKK
ncbi:MAG: hypothetical protein H7125_08580 [Proteobacteria bacterium]|nr:hypothetical protein [Burkholderiales bacterium]